MQSESLEEQGMKLKQKEREMEEILEKMTGVQCQNALMISHLE